MAGLVVLWVATVFGACPDRTHFTVFGSARASYSNVATVPFDAVVSGVGLGHHPAPGP